jgi:hypothetical protein
MTSLDEFMDLVRRYGIECENGGMGYTHDDSAELFVEIEKEVRVLMTKSRDALKVQCPRCHAKPGQRCVAANSNGAKVSQSHRARLKAAGLV